MQNWKRRAVVHRRFKTLHAGFEFSEVTSVKCTFDVEIENLKAEIFEHAEKTKIVLGVCESQLIERSRPKF
jgi:phosphoribosylformylglycinamidine (FGAM) synthase-like amidotransferase family enzyme